jgi:hypothetical protein
MKITVKRKNLRNRSHTRKLPSNRIETRTESEEVSTELVTYQMEADRLGTSIHLIQCHVWQFSFLIFDFQIKRSLFCEHVNMSHVSSQQTLHTPFLTLPCVPGYFAIRNRVSHVQWCRGEMSVTVPHVPNHCHSYNQLLILNPHQQLNAFQWRAPVVMLRVWKRTDATVSFHEYKIIYKKFH